MATIKSFPNNKDEFVGAENEMRFLHGRTSGVFGADRNAAVYALKDKLSVEVTDGIGWISNEKGYGSVWWNDTFEETGKNLVFNLDIADSTLNRIDRIVVSYDTTKYTTDPRIEVLKGELSAEPVPPALTNNNILRQISLAKIEIRAGTVTLNQTMITDERLDKEVCGIVNDHIEVDTSMIDKQFKDFLGTSEKDFLTWFKKIKESFGEDTASNLLSLIIEVNVKSELLEDIVKEYVTYTRFSMQFDTLNGITTNGYWNETRQIIEC